MNTKTLTPRALSVIDQYLHFKVGAGLSAGRQAVCSVPYFNNKTVRARASLRAEIGKGSPKDIYDEAQAMLIKQHVSIDTLADESLKKMLADNNIGIDCSGFAYYVLNAESAEAGKGPLDKHISFVNCKGILGKMRAKFRPAENCDVTTLADDKNSRIIPLNETSPGDIVTMIGDQSSSPLISNLQSPISSERDHILIIHQVDYQNFSAFKLYYSHAVAYPEDGLYGSGVKQGTVEITDSKKTLTEQEWIENGKSGDANRIYLRALKSKTELRRLKWL